MGKKLLVLLAIIFNGPLSWVEGTATLSPLGPVTEIISAASIGVSVLPSVAVSGTTEGFLILCEDGNRNLDSCFSALGTQTWGTVIQTPSSTTNLVNGPVLISKTSSGAMASWLGDTIGFNSGYAYGGFTPDHGVTWPSIIPLGSVDSLVVFVGVSGSPSGFMFVWYDDGQTATYWAWSTYNGSSWVVSSAGTIPTGIPIGYPAQVAGTSNTGFMATWVGIDNNVYASYTNNEGGTWTTQQVPLASNAIYAWVGGNANGFMVVWIDTVDTNIYSSFYNLESGMWQSSPSTVGFNVSQEDWITPYVTGSDVGFVVTWINPNFDANASISIDNGATWSPTTQITTDGSINPFDFNWGVFVGASIVDDTVLFTWADLSGNAQSRFYTIEGLPPSILPPATLTGSKMSNDFPFVRQFVNNLKWTASPSSDVVSYNVYKNGNFLDTVPAGGSLVYNDLSNTLRTGYTYGVTSVDTNQQESSAITVFVK